MLQHNLSSDLVTDILIFLDCPEKRPTLRYLNNLIYKYIRKVPWESVSRIVKRHALRETKDCPRLPREFWQDAMQYGFGGTCFESSLAFYSLLAALGYKGYLTVNDMGDTRGCHAAIMIVINGKKYLVDITIPLHAAVLVDPLKTTRKQTSLYDYAISPLTENIYSVDRTNHPNRNAFTLIDLPVNLREYLSVLENDYLESGNFLKSVVMVKVIRETTWRFFSDHRPFRLESFNRDGKNEIMIEPGSLPSTLAELFQMPQDRISDAFLWIGEPETNDVVQLS